MRQNILPQAIASIHRYDGGPENVPPTHLRIDVIEQYQPEPRENIPVVSCVSRDRFGNINNINPTSCFCVIIDSKIEQYPIVPLVISIGYIGRSQM